MREKSELWSSVDEFIAESLGEEDAALVACREASAAAGLPSISVSSCQGKMLMVAARAVGARRILEIGTLGGYSTIWLARGLTDRDTSGRVLEGNGFGREGRVVTLEANAQYAAVARENIERAGLGEAVEVRIGRAIESLPVLAGESPSLGPFDLVFIDADKAGTPEYFAWALRLSRPGTLIIVDNVVRDGKVIDRTSDDPSVLGMRKFFEVAGAEPRVAVSALQTVGSKGHDGFAVALVLE